MNTLLDLLRAFVVSITMLTFGIYTGAIIIALIAALCRLAYTENKLSIALFGKFFIMSACLTMLIVHIGNIQKWSNDLVVIVSGVVAFLAREVLVTLVNVSKPLMNKWARKLK